MEGTHMKSLFFGLTLSVLFFFLPSLAFAQLDVTPTLLPSPAPEISYEMPYPGLLPDNPFYVLKTSRDQMVGFLIADPKKKADFDILQAEKRFRAGMLLLEKDPSKKELAFATISKGQNYYEKSLAKLKDAKNQKVDVHELIGKVVLSGKKQQEILEKYGESHPEMKSEVTAAQIRLSNLQKIADHLEPRGES